MTTLSNSNQDACSQILGVATATPPVSYSQKEMLDLYQVSDRRIASVFLKSAIDRRFLSLPPPSSDGTMRIESQGELLQKHSDSCIDMGSRALTSCLKQINADVRDVQYLCCVTTTGFLTPGVSALLCHKLDMRRDCSRLDVVGMGCNAGLNALNAVAGWARANPGKLAAMACIEVCSAAYVFDGTIETAVVNSLFGDGAAAVVVMSGPHRTMSGPTILNFTSCIIPEALDAMKFSWDEGHGKFSFYLDRDVPYVVGAHAEQAVNELLRGTDLRRSDIAHWIIHSGGKKVIDAMKVNLGLSSHDVRHTSSVLRDYGNLSSGSFLFSLERLIEEGRIQAGDHGVMITMGPGSTIETALVRW